MSGSTVGSEKPGELGRRKFLGRACIILAAPLALVIGYPLVASLVGTIYRKSKLQFSRVPGFSTATKGEPIKLSFTHMQTDAYLRTEMSEEVWVVKQGPSRATVFSPICPHMGCRCNWHSESQKFVCPCHDSTFFITGKVLGGPSPRPLDTLSNKIEDGALYVEWEQFATGISQKVGV